MLLTIFSNLALIFYNDTGAFSDKYKGLFVPPVKMVLINFSCSEVYAGNLDLKVCFLWGIY